MISTLRDRFNRICFQLSHQLWKTSMSQDGMSLPIKPEATTLTGNRYRTVISPSALAMQLVTV
jgi:hypothetical protein